jgi:hypothetical protein
MTEVAMTDRSELRRDARRVIDEALESIGRHLGRFRRKFPAVAFAEESGMVRTLPGGSYLITEDTANVDYTTGRALSTEALTPGRLWKFQNGRWGYCELTLTVDAERKAELTLTVKAERLAEFRQNSRTYPGDAAGWRRMVADLSDQGRWTSAG